MLGDASAAAAGAAFATPRTAVAPAPIADFARKSRRETGGLFLRSLIVPLLFTTCRGDVSACVMPRVSFRPLRLRPDAPDEVHHVPDLIIFQVSAKRRHCFGCAVLDGLEELRVAAAELPAL